ncbi:MAG: efflux RND transporter permease subunit, partial [Acetobacteraceae bacterium]|nr:efflux RND transporter permease subunit [Acetobacteraceae bacterium]
MRFNLSELAVRNGALTLFLILLLGAAGGFAYLKLGRAEDPSFTIKTMVVSAQWPGATADEMQAQVADRIESRLQDLQYLDYVQTYVRPGQAVVQVLLRDTTPPRMVPEMWYQVRKKLGDMRHLLPPGVQGPFADDEYSDVYAAVFALTGADNAELVRQAEALRLRFLQLPNAGKVAIFGEQAQQVFVEVSHARLATLGVQPSAIADALARNNAVAPAGVVETPSSRVWLRTDAGFDGLAAIRAVPVEAGGRTLRLGDIATIRR